MSLINKAIDRLLGGERKIKKPIFLKDFEQNNNQLDELINLHSRLKDSPKKELIERDIVFLKEGKQGENNVYYELANSFLPILCLYDIRLEYNGHVAQFDFIVISNKYICIIETKKLSGNIIINQDGDFIRVIKNRHGKEIKREGMYSPVSQNERHLNILREVLVSQGLIKHMPLKSLIVLANPHTIIDKKNCPHNIVNSIYKHDQVINFLKNSQEDKDNDMNVLEANLYNIANYLIANNKPMSTDYISKYGLTHDNFINNETLTNVDSKDISTNKKDRELLYKQLKEYRLLKSREENIKAFYIFNNEQMDDMISRYPTTEEDLMKVKGIGQKKVEKYGKDIINIFIS